ncbi:MAG: hypothetical protein LBJ63_06295 [Prevotellaceae bacterium]|jgi:hypothetical protein|nr:hypothetical protein [Prevotellaceae bacterium]
MKTIEEEWKTIEEFPLFEISNFGRCRHKKTLRIKKVSQSGNQKFRSWTYYFHKDNHCSAITVGKLVARYFVPNPNEYKAIRYTDGNKLNFIYTNIEWVNDNTPENKVHKKPVCTMECQIERLRKIKERIERQICYLENGKIGELIIEEIVPCIKEALKMRPASLLPHDEKEEFMSYAINEFIEIISKGIAVVDYRNRAYYMAKSFIQNKYKIKTVEFNERIM